MIKPGSAVVRAGESDRGEYGEGDQPGRIARDIASKLIPEIFDVTKSTTPTGGVTVPIIRLSTKMRPNCTGSMPRLRAAA